VYVSGIICRRQWKYTDRRECRSAEQFQYMGLRRRTRFISQCHADRP